MEKVVIDGMTFVKELHTNEMQYVIVRSRDAGVFAGYLEKQDGENVYLKKARRIWYWDGAATLSQLAMEGVSKPATCKFPQETEEHQVLNACEIINATEKSRLSIAAVPVWKI